MEEDNDMLGGVLTGTKKAKERRGEMGCGRAGSLTDSCTVISSSVNPIVAALIKDEREEDNNNPWFKRGLKPN